MIPDVEGSSRAINNIHRRNSITQAYCAYVRECEKSNGMTNYRGEEEK